VSKRNSRAAKVRRRNERAARETGSHDETPFPAYLESDESYLEHVLHAPDSELTDQQRQLREEIRAHHPDD
jgi:hypothetical protein